MFPCALSTPEYRLPPLPNPNRKRNAIGINSVFAEGCPWDKAANRVLHICTFAKEMFEHKLREECLSTFLFHIPCGGCLMISVQ